MTPCPRCNDSGARKECFNPLSDTGYYYVLCGCPAGDRARQQERELFSHKEM